MNVVAVRVRWEPEHSNRKTQICIFHPREDRAWYSISQCSNGEVFVPPQSWNPTDQVSCPIYC